MPRLTVELLPGAEAVQELFIAVVGTDAGEEMFVTEGPAFGILLPVVAVGEISLVALHAYAQKQATLLGKPVTIVPFTRCQPRDIFQPLSQPVEE